MYIYYLPSSLSDHTPMIIESPKSPLPPRLFHFCDMWLKDPKFLPTVSSYLPQCSRLDPGPALQTFLSRVKTDLLKLHRTKFADLHTQQIKAKAVLEELQLQLQHSPHCPLLKQRESQQREDYIKVIASALDLIRQQSKADWIGYGNDNTQYFHAQMRQRKMQHTSMIYRMTKGVHTQVSKM